MNILLDAKDLIDLIKFNRPVTANDFSVWLDQNNAKLVLSFANVSDFIGPDPQNKDFLQIRVWLQELEKLPVVYFRDGLIIRFELMSALKAFKSNKEPLPPDLYVSRWDQTFIWEEMAVSPMIVGLRLDDIVYAIRENIQNYKNNSSIIRQHIEWQRNLSRNERQSKKDIFIDSIPKRLKDYNIEFHDINLSSFCKWLWDKPQRCIGFRIHFEAYHQLLNDRRNKFQDGDIADFTILSSIPYVDMITVDKRISDILYKTLKVLHKHIDTDLSARVFASTKNLMDHTI
jgi:hypothetical protein